MRPLLTALLLAVLTAPLLAQLQYVTEIDGTEPFTYKTIDGVDLELHILLPQGVPGAAPGVDS